MRKTKAETPVGVSNMTHHRRSAPDKPENTPGAIIALAMFVCLVILPLLAVYKILEALL